MTVYSRGRCGVLVLGCELERCCGKVESVGSCPDDAQLIESSLSDGSAFTGIYDRHASVLLAYLTRRVGPSNGESLLGDVFRAAFTARSRYDLDRPDARPWLYGIASNLVVHPLRGSCPERLAGPAVALAAQNCPAPRGDKGAILPR